MPFSIDRPLSAIVLTVLLVLTTSSCHKKLVAVPVPSEPAPAVVAPHDQPPTTPTQPETTNTTNTTTANPAPTTAAPAPASPPKEESKYQKNKPPDQPPPPKRAVRPANPAPAAAPTPANATPADPPRLGDILTTEQQHQYNAAIDVSLAHAQASIDFIATRQLSKEQQATVAEILNFMQQAQEKRKNELGAAKSLAERAEVLSHDLVATLRGH
jgi:hypothetical protein